MSERPRTTVSVLEHCIPVSSADSRRHLRSANHHLLAVPRFRSTLTAVGRSQLLARWPGTHSGILSGIQRAAQTVLDVYLKRTRSRDTSASSALAVLSDSALYKSTHSIHTGVNVVGVMSARGLLSNPAMFTGAETTTLQCVQDWVSPY